MDNITKATLATFEILTMLAGMFMGWAWLMRRAIAALDNWADRNV